MNSTKQAQHTPGPWEIRPQSRGVRSIKSIESRVAIADVWPLTLDGIAEANAQLIAAAPDLLELAGAIVKWYEDAGNTDPDQSSKGSVELWSMARKAIAKVKGEA